MPADILARRPVALEARKRMASSNAPAWLTEDEPTPPAQPAAASSATTQAPAPVQYMDPTANQVGLTTAYNWRGAHIVQHLLRLGLFGGTAFYAAVAVLALGSGNLDNAGEVFVPLYMIGFAVFFGIFEGTRYFSNDKLEYFFLRNFGLMYGPIGRGAFYIFASFLAAAYAQGDRQNLAVAATGVLCAFGGLQILVHLTAPNMTDPPMDIRVYPKGVTMKPTIP